MRNFREIPQQSIDTGTARIDSERVAAHQQLPGAFPFWERNCALSGMTWIDFNPTVVANRSAVEISLSNKFKNTPLILSWFRAANSDLSYSDSTPIYKFPGNDGYASFNSSFFSTNNTLRFARHSITAYGTSTTYRVYIKFFLFTDDAFINPIDNTPLA